MSINFHSGKRSIRNRELTKSRSNTRILIVMLLFILSISGLYYVLNRKTPTERLEADRTDLIQMREKLFRELDQKHYPAGFCMKNFDTTVRKTLSPFENSFQNIWFVSNNLILVSYGGDFQSVSGIAITRKIPTITTYYYQLDSSFSSGFDGNRISCTPLAPEIYKFSAGL